MISKISSLLETGIGLPGISEENWSINQSSELAADQLNQEPFIDEHIDTTLVRETSVIDLLSVIIIILYPYYWMLALAPSLSYISLGCDYHLAVLSSILSHGYKPCHSSHDLWKPLLIESHERIAVKISAGYYNLFVMHCELAAGCWLSCQKH